MLYEIVQNFYFYSTWSCWLGAAREACFVTSWRWCVRDEDSSFLPIVRNIYDCSWFRPSVVCCSAGEISSVEWATKWLRRVRWRSLHPQRVARRLPNRTWPGRMFWCMVDGQNYRRLNHDNYLLLIVFFCHSSGIGCCSFAVPGRLTLSLAAFVSLFSCLGRTCASTVHVFMENTLLCFYNWCGTGYHRVSSSFTLNLFLRLFLELEFYALFWADSSTNCRLLIVGFCSKRQQVCAPVRWSWHGWVLYYYWLNAN